MFDDIAFAVRHVLTSPVRLRFLLSDGIDVPIHLTRFVRTIVPRASQRLEAIRARAQTIPDAHLRREALASIEGKAYHVAGAAILATFLPEAAADTYIEIVSPLESIYDYLDNLCDRHPDVSIEAYPVLHQAIADALDPQAPIRDYYAAGPAGDDGGYLRALVEASQRAIAQLDGYELLAAHFAEAARFYGEMQTFKHYPPGRREIACVNWYESNRERFAELDWHEFASAAGSQFQVYAPLYMLAAGKHDAIAATYHAYFPTICALHVLLDAYIDQAEDRAHGELNFATLYDNERAFRARIAWLVRRARTELGALPDASEHGFVLRTMLLFYLTHPKVFAQRMDSQAQALLRAMR